MKNNIAVNDSNISQEEIDEMIENCIKNKLSEKAWHIALSFRSFNFDNLIDYYVQEKKFI